MANPIHRYADIIGQEGLVSRLKAFTDLFKSSGTIPGHILLVGDAGMGQSTIGNVIANELGVGIQEASAASLEVLGDLTALLTNLRARQILVLSDIHLFRKLHHSKLLQVMREGQLQINIGTGRTSRTHMMEINPFTLVATCPKKSDCPPDLLDEFSLVLNIKPYSALELQTLATSNGEAAGISLEPEAAELIAKACDGRPTHITAILRRVTKAINKQDINVEDVSRAFLAFGIQVRSQPIRDEGTGSIKDLSGIDFEVLITGLLTRMGFHAEMTSTSGDGGIDIVAVLDKPIVGGRYLFQCKRFAPESLVGAPTIRDFYGAVTADRAVKGIFITTSGYTAQARTFAEKAGIELIDLEQLERLFLEYGLANLTED